MLNFKTSDFVNAILTSKRRKVLPLMGVPGAELSGSDLNAAYKDGEIQFKCLEALYNKFPSEAVFTFMDLSLESEAFGSPIEFVAGEVPTVSAPIVSDEESIDTLNVPDAGMGRSAETMKCARLCAESFKDTPVFAGMIGPFSLAGRLADMTEMLMMTAADPDMAHKLLSKTTEFLCKQAEIFKSTGVNGIIIAEPAAGLLSPEGCLEFSTNYVHKIIELVKDDSFMMILHNCGKTEKQVKEMLAAGADAIHVGNAVDITCILDQVPEDIPVMGNVDPVEIFKNSNPEKIDKHVTTLLEDTSKYSNFAISSGCDLPPGVSIENIKTFYNSCEKYNAMKLAE